MYVGVVDGSLTSELRRSVLRPSWPVGSAMFGDTAPDAVHLAALDDSGQPLSTCLMVPQPYPLAATLPAWQLRGMATWPEARSRGIGGLVVEATAAEAAVRGGDLLWCQAREVAVPFYERHGFVAVGERFLHSETAIPHFMMVRELSDATTSSPGQEDARG